MAKTSKEVEKLKKEFYEGMEKLRKERAETERLLRKLIKEHDRTDKQLKQTDKQLKQTDRQLKQTDRQLKQTDEQLKQVDEQLSKQIRNLGKQIGELTNGWGKFVEAMVQPAIPRLFRSLGVNRSTHSLSSRRNGREMEVDAVGIGDKALVIVSIKSRLRREDVDALLKAIPRFPSFFPEFAGKQYYGAVAGIRIDRGVPEYAQKQGFFCLGPSGETVKLLNRKGFKPKVW